MVQASIVEATEKLTKGEAANIITRLKHGAQVCPAYSLGLSHSNINLLGILREKDEGEPHSFTACRERETAGST